MTTDNDNTETVENVTENDVANKLYTKQNATDEGVSDDTGSGNEESESQSAAEDETEEGSDNANESDEAEWDDLSVPEGLLLSEDQVQDLKKFAKDSGLSKDGAEALLARENGLIQGYVETQQKQLAETQKGWLDSAKSDSEFGGADFNKNAEIAQRLIRDYGSEEFKSALNETKFGNHPELIRFCVRIGREIQSDTLVKGDRTPIEKPKPIEAKIFPKQYEQAGQ